MIQDRRVFLDLETAGLRGDSAIIQIGAVAVDAQWNEVDSFEQKILFNLAKAEPEALRLNSYSEEVWAREGVSELQAVGAFKSFLEAHRSVELIGKAGRAYTVARVGGHNLVSFDLPRLSSLFKRYGQFLPIQLGQVLDTLQGASWFFDRRTPRPENLRLLTLGAFFGLDIAGAHDALADARLSAKIAQHLLEEKK